MQVHQLSHDVTEQPRGTRLWHEGCAQCLPVCLEVPVPTSICGVCSCLKLHTVSEEGCSRLRWSQKISYSPGLLASCACRVQQSKAAEQCSAPGNSAQKRLGRKLHVRGELRWTRVMQTRTNTQRSAARPIPDAPCNVRPCSAAAERAMCVTQGGEPGSAGPAAAGSAPEASHSVAGNLGAGASIPGLAAAAASAPDARMPDGAEGGASAGPSAAQPAGGWGDAADERGAGAAGTGPRGAASGWAGSAGERAALAAAPLRVRAEVRLFTRRGTWLRPSAAQCSRSVCCAGVGSRGRCGEQRGCLQHPERGSCAGAGRGGAGRGARAWARRVWLRALQAALPPGGAVLRRGVYVPALPQREADCKRVGAGRWPPSALLVRGRGAAGRGTACYLRSLPAVQPPQGLGPLSCGYISQVACCSSTYC